MSAIVENAIGGLIANEAHGIIGLVLSRINEEIKLAWGFKTELQELQRQLTRLSGLLQGASGQPVTNPLMADWLHKIKDAAYDADDLLDEWSYEALKLRTRTRKRNKFIDAVFRPFSRHGMAHKVRHLRKLIGSIYNDAEELGIKPIKVAAGDVYSSYSAILPLNNRQWVDHECLLGRDEDLTRLVELLCDPANCNADLTVTGIVGLAGLGKTTLSKQISKIQKVTEFFNSQVIWVVVSHKFDLRDTLKKFAEILFRESLNLEDSQAIVLKLQQKLKGDRYLLILDDVWDTFDWEPLRWALHEVGGSKGTSLLVTSRDKYVVERMETYIDHGDGKKNIKRPIIHQLQGLSEGDSWSLLMARMNVEDLANNDKELIAKRMMKKCGGVPLAIRALGDLLRDKSIRWWKEIETSDLWTKEDEYGILPSLKLSYNYLPNTALKKCFAYCAIFEEDEVIEKEILINMWMAHGFLQPYHEMELKGEEYFKVLLNSSLFQEAEIDELGNVMTLKMHDLVLSLAHVVSKGDFLCSDEYDGSNDVRHLSTPSSIEGVFERELTLTSCKKLRTCLKRGLICSVNFLLDCRNIRVLCLEWFMESKIKWEPIGNLKHLRYLEITHGHDRSYFSYNFRLCEQIMKLYHLQTLWIRSANPVTVASPAFIPKEVGTLVNLRHIHVDRGSIGIPVGLSHLIALQTLPAINLEHHSWGGKLSELGSLNNLSGTLEIEALNCVNDEEIAGSLFLGEKSNLNKLVLRWRRWYDEKGRGKEHHRNAILEALQPHPNLAMLEVYEYGGSKFPGWLIERGSPLSNLVSLKLWNCKYAEGYLKLENFRYLRFLSLEECNSLSISFPNHGFQCCKLLEVLEFSECDEVGSLPDLSPLTHLGVLKYRRCVGSSRTKIRCELVGLSSLLHLRELHTDIKLPADLCEDSPICKSLETFKLETPDYIDDDDDTEALPAQLQHMVALQNLDILGFKNLETLPDWLGKLTSLRKLQFYSMPKLKYLPSEDAMHNLSNLNTFHASDCPLSEDLWNRSGEWVKISRVPHIYTWK